MAVKIYNVGLKSIKISEDMSILNHIEAYNGSSLVYQFEKLDPLYDNPVNTSAYSDIASNSGENFYYRLSDTGDDTGTFVDLTNVNEMELSLDVKRFDYGTSYRFWIDLPDIIRLFWLRGGGTGNETGDLNFYTLSESTQMYPVLSDVSLFNTDTYRILINNNGTKLFVGGTEMVSIPSNTMDTIRSAGITTASLEAHVGSNKIRLSNIDWKFS